MGTLTFERGDADHPAGHAFLYFPGGDEVVATYIVVAPITFDLGRYVPPLLASSLGSSGILAQTSFFPIPPVPEKLSIDELRRLASWRGDDIIVDRSVVSSDPTTLMARVAEIGDAYARAYQDRLESAPVEEPRSSRGESRSENVEGLALLYSTLPEHERIEEMARRLGKLRYAAEGNDGDLVDATCAEMRAIAAYLPEKYRARELIEAARRREPEGARLAQLYVERGYRLASSNQEDLSALEAEIASLERRYA